MAQPTRHSTIHRELAKRRYRPRTVERKDRDPHRERREQRQALRTDPDALTPLPDGGKLEARKTLSDPET